MTGIVDVVAALNWPATGLILGLAVIVLFRRELAARVAGALHAKRDVLSIDGQPGQVNEEPRAVEEFFKRFASPVALEMEHRIRQYKGFLATSSSADREQMLIRGFATALVLVQWERCAGAIWASQLASLNYLNSRTDAEIADLAQFYERGKSEYPDRYERYPFEQWLMFLQSFGLIARSEAKVGITTNGREFLKFLVDAARPMPTFG